MLESVVDFLKNHIPPELVIFVVSMLPIFELRGGLIAAALLHINWFVAFPICVIANLVPIPLELLFIRKILNWLKKTKHFKKMAEKLDARAKQKASSETMLKYKSWGLYLFVAIPLPGTGAWTGGLVADILDIRFRRSFPLIALGVLSAGLIMSFFSYLIPMMF